MPNCILNNIMSYFICLFKFFLHSLKSFCFLLSPNFHFFSPSIHWEGEPPVMCLDGAVSNYTVTLSPYFIFRLSTYLCQTYCSLIHYLTFLFEFSRVLCLFLFTALIPITAAQSIFVELDESSFLKISRGTCSSNVSFIAFFCELCCFPSLL